MTLVPIDNDATEFNSNEKSVVFEMLQAYEGHCHIRYLRRVSVNDEMSLQMGRKTNPLVPDWTGHSP